MSASVATTENNTPMPTNFVAQTFAGFFYPLRAIGFITRNNMWPLTMVAIMINAVLLILLIVVTLWVAVPWLNDLDVWLMSASDAEWLQPLLGALSWFVWILSVLVIIAANAVLLVLLGQAVASPFLDMLSERVEQISIGTVPAPFTVGRTIKSVVMALSDLVWSLMFLVAFNAPILLIGIIIPVVGTAAAAVASFVFTALVLAQEFVTMPAGRQMVPFRKRFGMIWRNRWLSFGFGIATMGIMMVPGLNLLLLPLAAVGGTMAYCDLHAAGRANTQ